MKCLIESIERIDRDNSLSYFIIKAKGTQGDANASVIDENGFINPFACMSRTLNFTKTLFPATEEQVEALDKVQIGTPINLMLFSWKSPQKFNIVKDITTGELYTEDKQIERTADKDLVIDGKRVRKGEKYFATESVAKVFESVNLTLFCDADEHCVEGNCEELAKRAWERGLSNSIYLPVE